MEIQNQFSYASKLMIYLSLKSKSGNTQRLHRGTTEISVCINQANEK